MAKIHCSFSGLHITCSHVPMTLAAGEGAHPIFYLPQKKLLGLYSKYCKGQLTDIDSYLLLLALLNSTDAVKFATPCVYSDKIPSIVARSMHQLVTVIWETNAITLPRFKQPEFCIRTDTSGLRNVDAWIAAWRNNITQFKLNYADERAYEALVKAENKLTYVLNSSTRDAKYAAAVADWAAKAAEFPPEVSEQWQTIIRKCFNVTAMFSTPKATLHEIKNYCECNIEVGSMHFHALSEVLIEGIRNHCDFLGMWDPTISTDAASAAEKQKEDEFKANLVACAPEAMPVEADYPSKLAYLRAKMAFQMSQRAEAAAKVKSDAVGSVWGNRVESNGGEL